MYIPFYRSGWGYPGIGYGYGYGYPTWNYGGYGYGYGSNIVGSAIANQSVVNTGTASGINQIATPSVIW
jgi:hypothetical protein